MTNLEKSFWSGFIKAAWQIPESTASSRQQYQRDRQQEQFRQQEQLAENERLYAIADKDRADRKAYLASPHYQDENQMPGGLSLETQRMFRTGARQNNKDYADYLAKQKLKQDEPPPPPTQPVAEPPPIPGPNWGSIVPESAGGQTQYGVRMVNGKPTGEAGKRYYNHDLKNPATLEDDLKEHYAPTAEQTTAYNTREAEINKQWKQRQADRMAQYTEASRKWQATTGAKMQAQTANNPAYQHASPTNPVEGVYADQQDTYAKTLAQIRPSKSAVSPTPTSPIAQPSQAQPRSSYAPSEVASRLYPSQINNNDNTPNPYAQRLNVTSQLTQPTAAQTIPPTNNNAPNPYAHRLNVTQPAVIQRPQRVTSPPRISQVRPQAMKRPVLASPKF